MYSLRIYHCDVTFNWRMHPFSQAEVEEMDRLLAYCIWLQYLRGGTNGGRL
ncbi:hypothetical protein HanOQP8_Chr14g0510371 [Helianthus annuus]|nr:hypothetical protein HanOQP8_Chr14g0510371 [Helianthus annuus]